MGLRQRASELRARLDHLERHDWPRWLSEADQVSLEITELLRRATEIDRQASAQPYDGLTLRQAS